MHKLLLVLVLSGVLGQNNPDLSEDNIAVFDFEDYDAEYLDFQKLSDEFFDPPMSSWPGTFWCWLNGDVTKTSITKDLEEMKAKGISRAEIWDVAAVYNPEDEYGIGPQFLGDDSVQMIKHALSEGKRLGMRIGMVGSSGWNAGGSWVAPEWASKALYFSNFELNGPQTFSGELPFPELPDHSPKDASGKPVFYKEVAVLAIPGNMDRKIEQLDDIIILNKQFDGKVLNWEVPKGNWVIVRFICSNTGQTLIVPSPESSGLFIDFLDPEATKRHLGYILNRLGITLKNAKESGLSYIEFDSMELDRATPWTNAMDSIFHSHHGFDILPFLPVFSGWEIPGGNDNFLYKFNKTVSDQLIFSHYTTGRDFLAQYGMELVAEAGGPGPPIWNTCPVDAIKALGNVSIPRGEFWIRHRNMFLIKEVASASHTYGLGLVDAESFTTWRRWKDAPHDLKKYVDRAFCEGLNTVTIHTFANTRPEHGFPGRTYHAGIDINPGTTWWKQARPFMDYLSRCSYLLTQGLFVADVAYYYGDKAPNFFPEFHDVPEKPGLDGLNPGYDFDIINTDVLLNRMQVQNNRIVLPDGMSYALLVLPDREDIPDKVVERVENMIQSGAKVLIQGSKLAEKMEGNILTGISIDDALAKLSIPKDFTSESGLFDYIHRKIGKTDLYFVRNKTDKWVTDYCSFRVNRDKAELWDPVKAGQYQIRNVQNVNKIAQFPLQLAPNGSCFIVFDEFGNKIRNTELPDPPDYKLIVKGETVEIKGPWTLNFPEKWGAPEQAQLSELISWTDNSDPGIKYFSGTASYHNKIHISEKGYNTKFPIYLDLNEVFDVAEVFINGTSAGILWTKPFILDIRDFVKVGVNDLRIEITNMWVNRLTGDMELPLKERFTKTNQPFIVKDNWAGGGDETYHLQKAGLLGPVKLEYGKLEIDQK